MPNVCGSFSENWVIRPIINLRVAIIETTNTFVAGSIKTVSCWYFY